MDCNDKHTLTLYQPILQR